MNGATSLRWKRRLAATATLGVSLWLCGEALGQPSAEDTAAARALFDEGRQLADAEQWDEAADRFERALALRSSPAIEYNLAVVYERLGRLVDASEHLRAVLREAAPTDRAYRPAETLLRSIEPRLGRLTIVVEDGGEEAEILLDGKVVTPARLGVTTPADPGTHLLVVRRGGAEASREVVVEEGRESRVVAPMPQPSSTAPTTTRVAPVPRATPPGQQHPDEPPRSRGPSWPLVLGGIGVAGAGLALDLVPASAHDGELGVLDLVPLGLYAGGTVLVALGVFQ